MRKGWNETLSIFTFQTCKMFHPSTVLSFIRKGCNCIVGDNLIQMFYVAFNGKLKKWNELNFRIEYLFQLHPKDPSQLNIHIRNSDIILFISSALIVIHAHEFQNWYPVPKKERESFQWKMKHSSCSFASNKKVSKQLFNVTSAVSQMVVYSWRA